MNLQKESVSAPRAHAGGGNNAPADEISVLQRLAERLLLALLAHREPAAGGRPGRSALAPHALEPDKVAHVYLDLRVLVAEPATVGRALHLAVQQRHRRAQQLGVLRCARRCCGRHLKWRCACVHGVAALRVRRRIRGRQAKREARYGRGATGRA